MAKLVRVTGLQNVYLCIPRTAIRKFDINCDAAWVDARRFKRHQRRDREHRNRNTDERLRHFVANREAGQPRLRTETFYSLPIARGVDLMYGVRIALP